MLEFLGGMIGGGWNAVSNIVSGIGKGASSVVSSFFPAQQKTTTISQLTLERENQGATFRPVKTDASSLFEGGYVGGGIDPYAGTQVTQPTSFWSGLWSGFKSGILGQSPTIAGVKAIQPTVTTIPSATATGTTQTKQVGGLEKMLQDVYNFGEEFATGGEKVLTLADRLTNLGLQFGLIKPRATTVETPRAGAPEGIDVQYLSNLQSRGAEVLSGIAATADEMWNQVKGLFNLGYSSPEGGQPVFTISHEIEPSTKTTTGLIIAGVVLFVLYLILRKK
jgi:hypothetical protein